MKSKIKLILILCIVAILSGVLILKALNQRCSSIQENLEVLSDPEWFDIFECFKFGHDEYGDVYICPTAISGGPVAKCSNPYGNIYYTKEDSASCYK